MPSAAIRIVLFVADPAEEMVSSRVGIIKGDGLLEQRFCRRIEGPVAGISGFRQAPIENKRLCYPCGAKNRQNGLKADEVGLTAPSQPFSHAEPDNLTALESERRLISPIRLAEIPREKYYLATKVGRYGLHMEAFDFSASRVSASVDESLKRLGVDYVDFIQVHDMEFGDLDQIVRETIPALRKVQELGKARFIGITGLPIEIFRYILDRTGVDQVQSYCHYCLNDTALADMLPYLKSKGVGIFNSAILAMGLLTLKGPPSWHPAPATIPPQVPGSGAILQGQGRRYRQTGSSVRSVPSRHSRQYRVKRQPQAHSGEHSTGPRTAR